MGEPGECNTRMWGQRMVESVECGGSVEKMEDEVEEVKRFYEETERSLHTCTTGTGTAGRSS